MKLPEVAVQGSRRSSEHLVRNSLRYASKADWAKITAGLETVYTAATVAAAEQRFTQFAETWRSRYPAMIAMWERSWPEFVRFLCFPLEIRKLIYTTNGIESLNARFRQAARRRGHFPTEQSAMKVLYLTVRERRPNRSNPTGQIIGWKSIRSTSPPRCSHSPSPAWPGSPARPSPCAPPSATPVQAAPLTLLSSAAANSSNQLWPLV